MAAPCIILPIVTNNPSLPTYNWQDIPNLPEFESDAGDHWIFDKGDADNLIGGLAGTRLSPAGSDPTYSASSLVTADGGMNGLASVFTDAATCTFAIVAKRLAIPGGATGRPIASSTTQTAADGGAEILDLGYNMAMRTREGAAVNMSGSSLIVENDWFFAALSCDGDANVQIYYVGGLAQQGATVTKTVSTQKIALGNAAINSAGYLYGTEAAEFIVWPDRALSAAELAAVYSRSKIRLSRRDIEIY
jgi:hypothetical protein